MKIPQFLAFCANRNLLSTFPHVLRASDIPVAQVRSVVSSDTFLTLCEEFSDIFEEDTLATVIGNPLHLHLLRIGQSYQPLQFTMARCTPLHSRSTRMFWPKFITKGVIEKVPAKEFCMMFLRFLIPNQRRVSSSFCSGK